MPEPKDNNPATPAAASRRRAATAAGARASARPDRDAAGGRADARGGRGGPGAPRPPQGYKVYRSAPRGLLARLRGENDTEIGARDEGPRSGARPGARSGGRSALRSEPERGPGGRVGLVDAPRGNGGDRAGRAEPERGYVGYEPGGKRRRSLLHRRRGLLHRRRGLSPRPLLHPLRLLRYAIMLVVFWVVLSVVLFVVSASRDAGNLPGGHATEAALAGAGPMLFTPNNILVLGLDVRPRTGYSSHEKGANFNELDANTDSIMIWRLGGGVSRRLSIPRDSLVDIPGCGMEKINAAWACGGPKETIQVVERFTGIKINHLIVVEFANFTKFIDDIGGVTVRTPRICSNISGGAANGGFTLDLAAGVHHLSGDQALTLARTRENSCNLAYDDFQRQAMQQRILNGIKHQLFSAHAFIHLPWAAWDAPGVLQTDMGPLQLMEMFVSSEIAGSPPAQTLTQHGGFYNGQDVQLPNPANVRQQVNRLMHGA